MKLGRPPVPPIQRFLSKIQYAPTGCWLWTGGKSITGYGHFWNTTTHIAHRFSFEFYKHKIKNGYQIDHLCRIKSCVNPDHLEVVTPKENVRRSPNSKRARKRCKRHHSLMNPDNVRIDTHRRGKSIYKMRTCRQCDAIRALQYFYRKKERLRGA